MRFRSLFRQPAMLHVVLVAAGAIAGATTILSSPSNLSAQEGTATPYPVSLVLSGPAEASPGSLATYRLSKEGDAGDDVVFVFPEFAEFEGLSPVLGESQFIASQGSDSVRIQVGPGSVVVDLAIQLAAGDPLGEFSVYAYVPGTGTTQSNAVLTLVTGTGSNGSTATPAPPATGVGPQDGDDQPVRAPLLLTIGAATAAAALASWYQWRKRL